jgi:hypothetical protein
LPSATLEEAPAELSAWMKQRTRWMKGYMQTCLTHGRRSLRSLRALGMARFTGAVTLTFGALLAALGYPFFITHLIVSLANGTLFRAATLFEASQAAVGLTLLVSGLFALLGPAVAAAGLCAASARLLRSRQLRRVARLGRTAVGPVPMEQDRAWVGAHLARRSGQRRWIRSWAACPGGRSRLKAPTNRPFLSIRYASAVCSMVYSPSLSGTFRA